MSKTEISNKKFYIIDHKDLCFISKAKPLEKAAAISQRTKASMTE